MELRASPIDRELKNNKHTCADVVKTRKTPHRGSAFFLRDKALGVVRKATSIMRCGLSVLAGIPVAVLLLNIAGMFTAPQQQRRIRFAATSFQRRQQMRGLTAEVSTVGPPHLSYPPPPPPPLPAYPDCNGTAHAELWGALVLAGPENMHNTAQECCASCRQYEPTLDVLNGGQCNAWVWSPETKHCWLKHQKPNELQHAVKMLAERRARPNPKIVWTSGVWLEIKTCSDCVTPASYNGCIGKDRCNTSRSCGSPAIDGYSHVSPPCFAKSPTALRYLDLVQKNVRLDEHHEPHADYDGLGVRWGIGHKKARWEDCEQACRDFRPSSRGGGPFGGLPCNVWTWCSEPVCFEPDAHKHSFGDCWLKFSEVRSRVAPLSVTR